MVFYRLGILVFALASSLCVAPLHAALIQVTRADDPVPDTCLPADCSLREAIAMTIATPEADQVVLQAGQYVLSRGALAMTGVVSIRGAGSDATRVVGGNPGQLLRVVDFGDIVLEGVEVINAEADAIEITGAARLLLRDVTVPTDGGRVGTDDSIAAVAHLAIENSVIADIVTCGQGSGSCRIVDSELQVALFVEGTAVKLRLERSLIGSTDELGYGIAIRSEAAVVIRDTIVRNVLFPLTLWAASADVADEVDVQRTRFLGNHGPINGDRSGIVNLQDVEIRGHVTFAGEPSLANQPSVLMAGPGPLWRLSRALVVGNRGGGTDGATIRMISGGRVGITNSTLDDNTFRSGVDGYAHAIGIYTGSSTPAQLVMMHNTLRRAPSLAANAPGSLLTVRGAFGQVMLINSLLRGTCAFGGGGSIGNAVGNFESPGTSCNLDAAQNETVPELQLHMGSLADHGGFTQSYRPIVGSVLIDAANSAGCQLGGSDQRNYPRHPEGVGCDVGSIEADAVSDVIFIDGFD